MIPSIDTLRRTLDQMITCKGTQGHDVAGLHTELKRLPDSYDALVAFEARIVDAPLREDWPYEEPNDLAGIQAASAADRETGRMGTITPAEAVDKARAAFLGAVCGCILGKPVECNPTLGELQAAGEKVGEWPVSDYITDAFLEALGRWNGSRTETTRETISWVAPDDDINYTIMGMLMLENHGVGFTRPQLCDAWLHNLPPLWTFGPERTFLLKAGMQSVYGVGSGDEDSLDAFTARWNPNDEACGAAIRVDAYGYACPGQPALAAELAWRDAGMTHNRTGIYGAMFVGAAIAAAFVAESPMAIFREALKHVPQKSRFFEIVADSYEMVDAASDWLEGYRAINAKYGQYGHCQIYQESALLINSAKFATSVDDGFCKQVMSGADTDCYGEIIGSILGAYYGPGHLDPRWLAPFGNRLHTSLASFHEQDLAKVAERMAQLPKLTLVG